MATGHIILDPSAARLPSSGAATKETVYGTNFPFVQLLFNGASDEAVYWQFRMPSNYASAPVLKIQWKSSDTAGSNVIWGSQINAYTPGTDTANYETDTLATADTTTSTDSTSAYAIIEASITISNTDSLAAGDAVILKLYRDADAGGDTLDGIDAEVVNVMLQYTTS